MSATNQSFSTNLGLTQLPEIDQAKYPEVWIDLYKIRRALTVLQGTLDTYTGALPADPATRSQVAASQSVRVQNIAKVYVKASNTCSFGQAVNLYTGTGILNARPANATDNTKPCRAYCSTPGGVLANEYGEFTLFGSHPYFNGTLTPGTVYYLGTADGIFTSVAPAAAGNLVQKVGFALDSSTLWFTPDINPTTV